MNRMVFGEPAEIKEAITAAIQVVSAGGVVLIPTESYYGLAVNPRDGAAVRRVYELKGRPEDLALPVVCSDWLQVASLVKIPDEYHVRLSRIWPAALSVVAVCDDALPAAVDGSLAVRIPDHGNLRALLYRVGPLTATSANRHGEPPSTMIEPAVESLIGAPDLVLDSGELSGGAVSTVVDLRGDEPRELRSGRVPWNEGFDLEKWVLQEG